MQTGSEKRGYILITGGSGGLGSSLACFLSSKGYYIFNLDKQSPNIDNENICYINTDITDNESVQNAVNVIKKQTGHLDAVIHFAGIYMMDSLIEIDETDFKKILDVNLLGVYRVNKEIISLLSDKSKIIIATSELAPLKPMPFNGIYSISKTVLDAYAYSLSMELALLGIHVVIVRPGAFDTMLITKSHESLNKLCNKTKLYPVNAARMRKIVLNETGKAKNPLILSKRIYKILCLKHPRLIYTVCAGIRLKLLDLLPSGIQIFLFKKILS